MESPGRDDGRGGAADYSADRRIDCRLWMSRPGEICAPPPIWFCANGFRLRDFRQQCPRC